MWEEYEQTPVEPEPPVEPTGPSLRWRIGAFLISLLVIVGMLGSGIAGLNWLFRDRAQQTAPPEPEVVIIDVTATPAPAEPAVESEAEPTAVSPSTEAAADPAADAPAVNRIVFVDGEGQVGTVDPRGENQRMLTEGNGRFQFPAWSPNGEQVAAIASERGGAAIYVLNDAADNEPTSLYSSRSEAPFYLYWAPDGEQISFLANHPDDPMALHLVPAAGGDSRIVSTGGPFYWDWTADGRQIFIHTGFAGDGARLAIVDTDNAEIGADIALPGYFQAPGISADGRFLAYAEALAGGNSRVVVAEAASGDQYDERHSGIAALGWSPSENKLAYISSAEADGDGFVGPLRLLDAETGEVTLLSRERVLAFFWSPNGRYIAYFSLSDRDDNEINAGLPLAPSGGKVAGLAKTSQQRGIPNFDLAVIDVTTGEGRIVLNRFQPSLLFIAQFLPFFDQYALSHSLWAPDSSALVLPILEDGRSQIFVVPTNGGQKRLIADGTVAFWSRQ